MEDIYVPGNERQEEPKKEKKSFIKTSEGLYMGKVFGIMGIGLAVSAIVCFVLAYVLAFLYNDGEGYLTDEGIRVGFGIMIGSAIALIIDQLVITFGAFKSRKNSLSIWIPYIIYATLIGLLLGTLVVFAQIRFDTIAEAFGITALVFVVMALLAMFTKISLHPLGLIGLGLLFGCMIASLFFGIWYLISPSTAVLIYWGINIIIIVAMMLITGWDIWRIRRMSEGGLMDNGLAVYSAFVLYTDFINIFIRLLLILARNRK